MTGRLRPGLAPATSPAERQARAELAVSVLDAREHRPVMVPRTQVKGDMRLLSRREVSEVRAACRQMMAGLGIEGHGIEGYAEWREAFNTRLVAIAVRSPVDHTQPLADLEDWEQCDEDQIIALWDLYQDMQAELDPLGDTFVLAEDDARAIKLAAKKKDVLLLTSYGSQKLARALTGLVDLLPN